MGFKLFDQVDLATEDIALSAAPLNIETVIATQEAFADIADIEKEHDNIHATISLANTVASNLGAQVSQESALLTKPESVTAGAVILSQESLVATAKLLGAEGTLAGLSVESMEANPVTSLELSIEEKQSLIKRVIETIKVLFKKFSAMFKKLYAKVLVAMTGTSTQIEKLKTEIADMKEFVVAKDNENVLKVVNGKLGAAVKLTGAAKVDKAFVDLSLNMSKTEDGLALYAIPSYVSGVATDIDSAYGKLKDENKGSDVKALIDEVLKGYSKTLVRFDGKSVKNLTVVGPEVDEKAEKITKQQAVDILAKVTFKIEAEDADEIKSFDAVGQDDLVAALDAVMVSAKDIKKFADGVDKVVVDANKTVDKLKEGDDDKKYLPVTKAANVIIGNAGIDMILGRVGLIKGFTSLGATALKEAKAADKKEDTK